MSTASDPFTVTRQQEIKNPDWRRPHMVLLGAGASRAALPNGDRNGMNLPLMREIAEELDLALQFPDDLRELAREDFEAAFSELYVRDQATTAPIEQEIANYFAMLQLPDQPTLYDALLLSLRSKDAIFTFNWDPLLFAARVRLNRFGLDDRLPRMFYLHGNVMSAYCETDDVHGWPGGTCSVCGTPFQRTRLLFPVVRKDYTSDPGIRASWEAAKILLEETIFLTIFG